APRGMLPQRPRQLVQLLRLLGSGCVRRLALACAVLGCTLAAGSGPLICAAAESAGDPAAFEQLLKLLSERRHGRVAFAEVHQLSILDQPLHSSGELLYDAPDRLEKRTLEPRAEDLLLE